MKPLYIQGSQTRIEVDGPALKIALPEQAERFFPLRRISQVISAHRVDWSTEALLACAMQGITVSFLDEEGKVLARVMGRPGERMEFRQRLADFVSRPDWRELYEQWLRAMEQMAVRSVVRRAGVSLEELPTAKRMRQLFRAEAITMNLLAAFERIGGEVHGLLVATATSQLVEVGIATGFEDFEGLELAVDLAAILFWDFQLARMIWLENRLRQDIFETPSHADIVAFFENRRDRTKRLLIGLLNRLQRWLIELY
jgi:hypothetical protein